LQNDQANKINVVNKKLGFQLPRSLSQPRHKSISHVRSTDEG